MDKNFYEQERRQELGVTRTEETVGRYTARTFFIMFLGLLVTFLVAFGGYATGAIYTLFSIPGIQLGLLVAELAVVIGMTAFLHRISTATATVFFFLYAVLNGVVFSAYFLIFQLPSLILVFAATALYFGGMAVFGYFTNIDLSRLRTVLFGGLIFLIIANLLMLLIPGLAVMDRVACTIGLIIFLGFTAYDTQKIKALYNYYSRDEIVLRKASIYSALQLYLDFVNMFLYVLRIFGKRRN